jgi:hypothetical protein
VRGCIGSVGNVPPAQIAEARRIADYAFTTHILLRAEYRGYVYKAPEFNLAGLNSDSKDAYCATMSRHRLSVSRGPARNVVRVFKPNTRATRSRPVEKDDLKWHFLPGAEGAFAITSGVINHS